MEERQVRVCRTPAVPSSMTPTRRLPARAPDTPQLTAIVSARSGRSTTHRLTQQRSKLGTLAGSRQASTGGRTPPSALLPPPPSLAMHRAMHHARHATGGVPRGDSRWAGCDGMIPAQDFQHAWLRSHPPRSQSAAAVSCSRWPQAIWSLCRMQRMLLQTLGSRLSARCLPRMKLGRSLRGGRIYPAC